VIASLAEGYHIGDKNLRQSDNASTPCTLDRATDEHLGEVVCYRADDGADSEKGEGEEKHWATTLEVGESDEVGLPYHGGKEE